MSDLFSDGNAARKPLEGKPREPKAREPKGGPKGGGDYSAKDIEVLEGLEPVRRRPGMYIGGTDERALHHLVAEILDNAMDEAVEGHASRIDVELAADQTVTVRDNGRGIPIDPHPKFKDKPAVEVILTTLHAGGKFGGDSYQTSGGLHGVGASVVNALSDLLTVEIARDRRLWTQAYSRGKPLGKLVDGGPVQNRRGTTITFHPDAQIFGPGARFRPALLYRMARSKAYLYRGVEIRWSCDPELITGGDDTPATATLHFPGGLADFLAASLDGRKTVTPAPFAGEGKLNGGSGRMEWAVAWPADDDGFFNSYCNTVPTPLGGTHETGLRTALMRGLKAHGELTSVKAAAKITAEDVLGGACVMLSVFIRDPQFQGQTKEKLATAEAARLVENGLRDHFDHWLSGDPETARVLLERIIERAEMRLRKREDKQLKRQSATRRLRLPGKLTDCSRSTRDGTEIFLVEGDSAGGSAKQARDRATQAVLPLRGKILNVASATRDKMRANQEISDITEALGCGSGSAFRPDDLRYDKVVIMTDADVDGAHIASLLMTFFYKEMPGLIENGHLFLAVPPLYRLTQGTRSVYARNDAHRVELERDVLTGRGKIEVSRFKGLGEMLPRQLKETTMDPATRTLLRVTVPHGHDTEDRAALRETEDRVQTLMGKKPELRFAFIQENARFVADLDV
ncbi:MAG: DNA topoisomerase IV subunit B [Rhodobacterales bacterium]|nr:DNA topoisomerase IV subunit B [Rhodobacterales bacterium]